MKLILFLVAAAAAIVLLISWLCYRHAFYVSPKVKQNWPKYAIPEGEIYEPFRDQMVAWMDEIWALPHTNVEIKSFDGLTLRGKFYEYAPGAPVELMFHGYRGSGERDLCGGVQRCFALERSALVVEQRGSAGSDGNIITFGIRESRDCLEWVKFAGEFFGPDIKLILTGISMGASTVLMAAANELPPNVVGVLADCGFTSAEEIIRTVIRQMGLPDGISYPFVWLGARLFAKLDLSENSALEAVKHCRLPVIFFHGDQDDYVPWQMSQKNFDACTAEKELCIIHGAGHGLSYLVDPQGYLRTLRAFGKKYWGL